MDENLEFLPFEIEKFRDSIGEKNPWMKIIKHQVQLSIFNGEFRSLYSKASLIYFFFFFFKVYKERTFERINHG